MALEAMERCISDLRKWMYRDKLKINDDKTEFLVIGSRQQLLKINHCSVLAGLLMLRLLKLRVTSALGLTRIFLCRPLFLCLVVRHFTGYIISRE